MSPYDPTTDPTYHEPGTTAAPVPSVRSVSPRQRDDEDDDMQDPFADTPAHGYSQRPPPIIVEKDEKHVAYAPVNPSDYHSEVYTDPYTPHNYSDDSVPLVSLRQRSRAEDKSKRYSTALPTAPLPHSPVPPGLAGGTGWLDRFEPAPVLPLIIHAVLCVVSFPVIFYLIPAANGLTMFWTRLIAGSIYGIVGLTLGVSLLDLSRRGIEAALWATIIHESMGGAGGVTLSQLDYHTANPDSPWAAILLLYRRIFKHRGTNRSRRKDYDSVPWSICIVLFLITATAAACLVFAFGRVVDIYTRQVTQTDLFREVTVIGDLSPDDLQRAANLSAIIGSNQYSWSLTPFSASAHLPKDRSFWITRPTASNTTDAVHFSEVYTRQLLPNGSGFGTYFPNMTAVWANATKSGRIENTMALGETIRWPRWGVRTVCRTLNETGNGVALVPRSTQGSTYMYVTRAGLQGLLSSAEASNIDVNQLPPANLAELTAGDSPTPGEIAEQDIVLAGKWDDDGTSHQFKSYALDKGESGLGWSTIDLVLVRLNESFAPQGQFYRYADGLGDAAARTRIGFDGAICVQEFRSYFLDAYNNTAGLPTTLGFLYGGRDFNITGKKQEGSTLEGVQRGINSTGKWEAFWIAHSNARNVLTKDNGRFRYLPNPTVVSFANGTQPNEYSSIKSAELQDVLGDVDCQHLLPYLVGSQAIVGHMYPDKTVAYAKVYLVWLIVTLLGDSLVNLPMGVGRLERLEELQRKAKDVPRPYKGPVDQSPSCGTSATQTGTLLPPTTTILIPPPPAMAQIEAKSWGAAFSVPEGRCTVNLDESALRMLEPAQHRRNSAQPTYHSFKYQFKPESIDVRKPGKVQAANPPRVVQDGVALDVEQLGSNNEDKHLFTATEQATKDLDVFMVFDPITGEFTMYEADSSVMLTYDRAASKAASRSRSRASPTTQPIAIPAVSAPPPKPTTTPVTFPVAAEPPTVVAAPAPALAPAPVPAKRTIQKPKTTKPKPKPKVLVKEPTPPPAPVQDDAEEGEFELEPVAVPGQTAAMDVDEQDRGVNAEPEMADAGGILPWEAVTATSHRRTANAQSTFNTADGPDEEVIDFGSFGALSRDPPRKTQPKSGRSGGIVMPKAGRVRDPPPRAPAPPTPPVVEDDDEDMVEVELPGMESHDFTTEMARQLGESSSEDDEEDEDEDEDGGFDEAAFNETLAQMVPQEDDSSDDEDSSSEEDD
ncbi:hypothetical protein FRC07_008492 [Ceratobasidium sp. 392]|nr:hypothetical protein FRC07_008492 [Ceratobasidium sp. 392]